MSDTSSAKGSPEQCPNEFVRLIEADLPRTPRTPRWNHMVIEKPFPFLKADEFSDLTITVGDRRLYTNKCLLCYNSPVFKKLLTPGQDKAKGDKSVGILDLSGWKYENVRDLIAFMDPRVVTHLSAECASRLLPLAQEFEMESLLKSSELTLTRDFSKLKRGRRAGYIAPEIALRNLIMAETHKFPYLQDMCMEELIANDNPRCTKLISESRDMSEQTKRLVLQRKLERVNVGSIRERRIQQEQPAPRRNSVFTLWKQ